ncbi:hypothetical protein BSL78_24734 [Apostichopus japonicus]|uniref:Uncharacterized protein n=1 Tax=Stichopus japonicus TaxID=307972 RepID=A0A2G8JRP8_STIJA|nr:hypothetical protein BSL78_24734 [Apostichopus japonicus]
MVVTSMASPDTNLDLSDTSESEVSPNDHAVGEDDRAPGQQNVASNINESQLQMYVKGLSREQLVMVAVELLRIETHMLNVISLAKPD